MKKILLISLTSLFCIPYCFPQMPNTDIWLLDVKQQKDTVSLSNPLNVTNRNGYDNQPAYSPDGTYILYTSIRDTTQSDIFEYDLESGNISQFTYTATSEYSPTFIPGTKNVSVVMVEKDSTQRLWSFPLMGGKSECLLEGIDSVGYHCWFDKSRLGLFILTKPFTLQLASLGKQKPIVIADSIGRCIKMKGNLMYYTRKNSKGENYLYQFNLPGLHSDKLIKLPGEDFCFLGDLILATGGSKVFVKPSQGDWVLVADLSSAGMNNLGRIAISPNGKKVAIVSEIK